MGILTNNVTDTRTKAQKIADMVILDFKRLAAQVTTTYQRDYDAIYSTPDVNPQDVLDAFSTSQVDSTANALVVFTTINSVMGVVAPDELKSVPDAYSPYTVDQATGKITLAIPPAPEPTPIVNTPTPTPTPTATGAE